MPTDDSRSSIQEDLQKGRRYHIRGKMMPFVFPSTAEKEDINGN
jgi:hypothetical protein